MSADQAVFLFWFALTLATVAFLCWFVGWPRVFASKPVQPDTAALDRDFLRYWSQHGDGISMLAAWAAWKACAAQRRRWPGPAEIWAAVFGIAGAWLLATDNPPAWGFGTFLLSNFGGIVFAVRQRHLVLLVQQLFFVGASTAGLWNWGVRPLLMGAQ